MSTTDLSSLTVTAFKPSTNGCARQIWSIPKSLTKAFLIAARRDPSNVSLREINDINFKLLQEELNLAEAEAAEMAGSAGRLFRSQIKMLQSSANTASDQLLLIDQYQWFGKWAYEIGGMAIDYKAKHQWLDADWEKQINRVGALWQNSSPSTPK